ncbi:MAG: hypothetical protein JJ979_05780 [Roseibium sp.]|nr:hypothetical protein [Roseibium sp.]
MITIRQSRVRPKNRVQTPSDKQPTEQTQSYIAPIGGWSTNSPLASPGANTALVLENFWPTSTSIEPRGGTTIRCTIAAAVEKLFQYRAGYNKTYFAADLENIYEFTDATVSGTALAPVISGQTNADYSTLEMQTDGGSYLTIVNGVDLAQIYDGTNWQQLTDLSAPFAITGISTDELIHIWAYRNRTFFIERGSMNAWYLGINSVAGPATKLPLAGVFNNGGALLFGATWSSDSGESMDDRCVFGTDQGEFAVYRGDPSDASSWKLEGVYEIGEPLGKNASMSVGGDLVIATKDGLIPISAAVSKDETQLKLYAHSFQIDPVWRREAILSGNLSGWRVTKWSSRNMAVVAPPKKLATQGYCWAVNLQSGAWAKVTGWTIGDIAVLGGNLHYGDKTGNIFLCDSGGFDNGAPFECRVCFSFDHLGAPGALKIAHAMKTVWKHTAPFNARLTVASDYNPSFGSAPSVPLTESGGEGTWDVSDWDVDDWATDSDTYSIVEKWESVSGQGETLAPQIQVTSAQNGKLDCELVTAHLVYSVGAHLP